MPEPNVPLSLAPRGAPRLLPASVEKGNFAALSPNARTFAHARELVEEIEADEWTEALAALARFKHSLDAGAPALDLVLTAAVKHLRLDRDATRSYTGRLLYVLGVARSIDEGCEFPLDDERVIASTRRALIASFSSPTGASNREEAARAAAAKGTSWAISEAAAAYVAAQDSAFSRDHWLTPYRLDYVFQQEGLPLRTPSETALAAAFAGFDGPIETNSRAEFLRLQVLKGVVVPRLLVSAWPGAVEAAERLCEREPLLSRRQDFADILAEARRLLDEQQ